MPADMMLAPAHDAVIAAVIATAYGIRMILLKRATPPPRVYVIYE